MTFERMKKLSRGGCKAESFLNENLQCLNDKSKLCKWEIMLKEDLLLVYTDEVLIKVQFHA